MDAWASPKQLFPSPEVDLWEAKLWSAWKMNSPLTMRISFYINTVPSSNAPTPTIFDYLDKFWYCLSKHILGRGTALYSTTKIKREMNHEELRIVPFPPKIQFRRMCLFLPEFPTSHLAAAPVPTFPPPSLIPERFCTACHLKGFAE